MSHVNADRLVRDLQDTVDRLRYAEQRVLGRARIAVRRTDRYVHANPWKAVGVVAGIAFVIGCLAASARRVGKR